MAGLLPVADALARILKGVTPLEAENISLSASAGRVLAKDVAAIRTQPPFPASAMDGYAVRAVDVAKVPCTLDLIGESAAGHRFKGIIGKGQAVRIFTGAPVPDGADTIVIQENVRATDGTITVEKGAEAGRYIRPAGLDFAAGDVLLKEATVIDAGAITLAAAMNQPKLPVIRQPRIAIIATGDELVMPGTQPAEDQIVASNSFGVSTIVRNAGGNPSDLGIAMDTLDSLQARFSATDCAEADVVVTLGGASVGDHDLVRTALEANGVELNFWKLAMRPGKPVMFGIGTSSGRTVRYIGLPGNPVSSLVCTTVFIVPLIRKMLGLKPETPRLPAILAQTIPANDQREEYMRATLELRDGVRHVTPVDSQDSSIITLYHKAQCLIIRAANGPEMAAGSACEIITI